MNEGLNIGKDLCLPNLYLPKKLYKFIVQNKLAKHTSLCKLWWMCHLKLVDFLCFLEGWWDGDPESEIQGQEVEFQLKEPIGRHQCHSH